MLKATFISTLCLISGLVFAQAQPKPDADFPFQGEYAGEINGGGGGQKFGIQVIALGDGKFRAVFYPGGLPGDGWTKDKPKTATDGAREDDSVTFARGRLNGSIKNGAFAVTDSGNKQLGTLKKIERESPTLGAKPPQGAIILFDGK